MVVRGAHIARPPHEPLHTIKCLVKLGTPPPSILGTGVIYPGAPALLGFNVADGALGKSVKQVTWADETLPP